MFKSSLPYPPRAGAAVLRFFRTRPRTTIRLFYAIVNRLYNAPPRPPRAGKAAAAGFFWPKRGENGLFSQKLFTGSAVEKTPAF
jgi:hypothetical protein